jgi:DNA polymerase-3 subunit epsilon
MNVIFWDTETNGLEKYHSVLSISAIKYSFTIEGENTSSKKTDEYERFYYRKSGEKKGEKAIAINGLTNEIIGKRRNGANYPEHFHNDIEPFRIFCSDTRHFAGHNILYDKQYINFRLPNVFCTMKTNTKIIGLRRTNGKPKFPSLSETARFYGIETVNSKFHGSMYDSYVTYLIFCKMLENEKAGDKPLAFLRKL